MQKELKNKMTKGLEPKLIPYGHTLYEIFKGKIENLKGKYFQSILSNAIIHIPEKNELGISYIENGKLSVWYPLINEWGTLTLDDFPNFALISEKQFKEYEKNQEDVFKYLLVHKNSQLFKEKQGKLEKVSQNNKANLSAQQKFDYYHPDAEGLAKLAREINETAKINQNLQKSLKNPLKLRTIYII